MKLLQSITGRIARLNHEGAGEIDRPEGRPFVAYGTIPGETVQVKTVKRSKEGIRSELEQVIETAPQRVTPTCPYAGTCGGCKWQHIDYAAQTAYKLERIKADFEKAGMPCPITSVIPAVDPLYYRNRMDYVFGKHGELGLKLPNKWWATLDLETCYLLSPDAVEVMKRIRAWARASGLPFWNVDTHEGFFRYLVIREGKRTNERLITLVTYSDDAFPQAKEEMNKLPSVLGDLATSIVWGINPLVTDLSISQEQHVLKGDGWIHEQVGGVQYKITPNAFFQTNTVMAEQLQEKVVEFCGDLKDKTLLDLYCGSGFFSLVLAPHAKRTIGIELDEEGIRCAKENALANNRTVEYFASKAEQFDWRGYAPDVVILDPPRAGMHPDVIDTLLEVKPPVLVYVSCSYPRFIEEMKKLGTVYDITDAAALDLFPHTPHVECVFKLVRK